MNDVPRIDVRSTVAGDIPALQAVLDGTELFPSEMLPHMLAGYRADAPADIWLTAQRGGAPVGLCFSAPKPLTEGTWTVQALAVLPVRQGGGIGTALTARLEDLLTVQGARILIVDMSGIDRFARTRAFHDRRGYRSEARIRDYRADGDDKVTFRKRLV